LVIIKIFIVHIKVIVKISIELACLNGEYPLVCFVSVPNSKLLDMVIPVVEVWMNN